MPPNIKNYFSFSGRPELMLNHIFKFVQSVSFFIGALNKRSQISIERFGAVKTREEETAYYGEAPKLDYVYEITKEKWKAD